MKQLHCDLFLMWPPGAGGNFLLSLYTWGSIDAIPIKNNLNLYDAQPFPSVAQIDTMEDEDKINKVEVICTHFPNDNYVNNYNFKCDNAWAVTVDEMDTWSYITKLANIKQSVQNTPSENQLNRYNNLIEKMRYKIDNLQLLKYNDIFVNRTVFTSWTESLKSYHEKNLQLA